MTLTSDSDILIKPENCGEVVISGGDSEALSNAGNLRLKAGTRSGTGKHGKLVLSSNAREAIWPPNKPNVGNVLGVSAYSNSTAVLGWISPNFTTFQLNDSSVIPPLSGRIVYITCENSGSVSVNSKEFPVFEKINNKSIPFLAGNVVSSTTSMALFVIFD